MMLLAYLKNHNDYYSRTPSYVEQANYYNCFFFKQTKNRLVVFAINLSFKCSLMGSAYSEALITNFEEKMA